MTALTADKKIEYTEGVEISIPVDDGDEIFAGALVCVNAAGYAVEGVDGTGLIFMGVAREYVDNTLGLDGAVSVIVRRRGLYKMTLGTAISQANIGDNVFVVDDQTVDLTAYTTYDIFCGIIAGYIDSTHAWIDIEPAIRQADVATHIADTSSAHAASAISVADSGTIITATEVEAALAEIMTGIKTAQYTIQPVALKLETGAVIPAFANGSADGYTQLSNKTVCLRWNDGSTPTDLAAIFVLPQDLNDAADIVVHLMGAIVKAGGSEADSPKITCEVYFEEAAAAPAAGSDVGGDSGEFLTAATNTWQEKTLTVTAANVPAAPTVMTLVFHPKDGELGTDDFVMLPPWLEVTRKCLTS
jgi:hypothetical protein